MSRFIMVRRRVQLGKDRPEEIAPTWINLDHVKSFSGTIGGGGTRIVMTDGFLLAEDDVASILTEIRRAEG